MLCTEQILLIHSSGDIVKHDIKDDYCINMPSAYRHQAHMTQQAVFVVWDGQYHIK